MLHAIRRAALLGYKITFLPSCGGTSITCREFPERGPCSTAWRCPDDADDEKMALGINCLIDSLFETIERLPEVPPISIRNIHDNN